MNALPSKFIRNIVNLFGDAGGEWLEGLRSVIAACEHKWSITTLAPLENLSFNYIAPAIWADGTQVILKIGVPNPELTTEIEALSIYDGRGSVKLLDVDRDRGALLLERLKPGIPLLSITDDEKATRVAAQVMQQLWRPVPPDHHFPTVGQWAAGLVRLRAHFNGSSGPIPKALLEKAERFFSELLDSMDKPVLLHGDLHHENILSAERQPWLAIDPKGIIGEREYEVGALLRNMSPQLLDKPQPSQVIARRVDIFAEEMGFDRLRLFKWGFAQAVLSAWWCIEDHTGVGENFTSFAELIDEVMR